jgi:nicotinamide-nucleotide amidase
MHGTVHPDVAAAMAHGVRARFGSTYGVGLTGVAGPDSQEGHPPGTVFVALVGAGPERMLALTLTGSRRAVRQEAVRAALDLIVQELDTSSTRREARGMITVLHRQKVRPTCQPGG